MFGHLLSNILEDSFQAIRSTAIEYRQPGNNAGYNKTEFAIEKSHMS